MADCRTYVWDGGDDNSRKAGTQSNALGLGSAKIFRLGCKMYGKTRSWVHNKLCWLGLQTDWIWNLMPDWRNLKLPIKVPLSWYHYTHNYSFTIEKHLSASCVFPRRTFHKIFAWRVTAICTENKRLPYIPGSAGCQLYLNMVNQNFMAWITVLYLLWVVEQSCGCQQPCRSSREGSSQWVRKLRLHLRLLSTELQVMWDGVLEHSSWQ